MTVPAPLERFLPYAKFVVALAGVLATVLASVLAGPPAWAGIVIAAVSALGVFVIPNDTISAVLVDGKAAVRAGEAAVSDVKAGNLPGAQNDITVALRAVQDGVKNAEEVIQDVKDAG